ncbi:MAG: hypothetical protein FD177_2437 [Desulfovibrionaceae bacterium]|nr:MAG: hypothetical protein FD177_2437 [Desulfovibrionaceae bacterium]
MGTSTITHRDCAGQAQLVRDIKRNLDREMEQDLGPERVVKARRLAVNLSRELKALETMCARCRA